MNRWKGIGKIIWDIKHNTTQRRMQRYIRRYNLGAIIWVKNGNPLCSDDTLCTCCEDDIRWLPKNERIK